MREENLYILRAYGGRIWDDVLSVAQPKVELEDNFDGEFGCSTCVHGKKVLLLIVTLKEMRQWS